MEIDDVYTLILRSNITWDMNSSDEFYLTSFKDSNSNDNFKISNNVLSGGNRSNLESFRDTISIPPYHHSHHRRSSGEFIQTGIILANNKTESPVSNRNLQSVKHKNIMAAMKKRIEISHRGHADNSLEKNIASALHTASITICSILVFEVRKIFRL